MRTFGLIGFPLSHSFSQKYFAQKFNDEGITDAGYRNFPLQTISELPTLLRAEPDLAGLNVTIPYKQQVISFLDDKNTIVEKTRACNCIRILNGKLHGFNTDAIGFEVSLKKKLLPRHSPALVLGTGGASKSVEYVLQQLGISYKLVSRNPLPDSGQLGYAEIDRRMIRSHPLIINTSPVGMFPHIEEYPALPYADITSDHYLFDLIYNPAETLFLRKGKEQGALIANGYDMLVIQAEESWRIWNQP
jgi:shikimate dehydrogenase